MNIPTDIVQRINSELDDPISKSTIYTFMPGTHRYDDDGNMLFQFPYSKNTYWTNYKYICDVPIDLEFELILVTNDEYICILSSSTEKKQIIWHDTTWPLPSINIPFNAGIYLRVKPSSYISNITIYIGGFIDLFPKVDNYILLNEPDMDQFIFSKVEKYNMSEAGGSVYKVYHYDNIRDIILKACVIRLLKLY